MSVNREESIYKNWLAIDRGLKQRELLSGSTPVQNYLGGPIIVSHNCADSSCSPCGFLLYDLYD